MDQPAAALGGAVDDGAAEPLSGFDAPEDAGAEPAGFVSGVADEGDDDEEDDDDRLSVL